MPAAGFLPPAKGARLGAGLKTGILCAIALAAWANAAADDDSRFSASASCELASAFLSTSGGLCDTYPVAMQTLDWRQGLGGFGYVDGYFWSVSDLHDRQRESHRAILHCVEGAVCCGHDAELAGDFVLRSKCGPFWSLALGYEDAHMKCWGPIASQSLDNPYVVPYWSGLWLLEPHQSGRVAAGCRKGFSLFEGASLTAFAESVWMDHRRFSARYGGEPEEKAMLGGAVAFVVFGVRFDWSVSQNVKLCASASQYDVVNPQARDSTRRGGRYYDKCDWPIFSVGVTYVF